MDVTATKSASKTAIQFVPQRADYSYSERVAKEHGGRLATLREFLVALKDPQQFENLKGYSYWLSGAGLDVSKYCKLDHEKGMFVELREEEWNALPANEKVFICPGSGPLLLGVATLGERNWLDVDAGATRYCSASRVAFVQEPSTPTSVELRRERPQRPPHFF